MAWVNPPSYGNNILTASEMDAVTANLNLLKTSLDDLGNLSPPAETELTVAAGVVTVDQNFHNIDTQSDDATDELDTINLGTNTRVGHILFLRNNTTSRDTTVMHGTGNIELSNGEDYILGGARSLLVLVRVGATWREISRANVKGITTMLAAPVQALNSNTASIVQGWDAAGWATLNFGADAPAGTLAVHLIVAPTNNVGAVVAVRSPANGEQFSIARNMNTGAGTLDDSDGFVEAMHCLVQCDANGDVEWRVGNANAGSTVVGVEIWITGRVDP